MRINCLIIEDEPLAVDVIEDYVRQVPFLNLIQSCRDALSALQILKSQKVDLIFLDIHLPKLKGLDFLSTLKHPPKVIITSAYQEYALKSYEYQVLDYLLKPFDFERFLCAVNRLLEFSELVDTTSPQKPHLYFTVNKKKARVVLDEIRYIESQKENIKIVTGNKTIVTNYPIGELEQILDPRTFIRVHRSFIISKDYIDLIDANDLEIGGKEIPIGRNYRASVFLRLGLKPS